MTQKGLTIFVLVWGCLLGLSFGWAYILNAATPWTPVERFGPLLPLIMLASAIAGALALGLIVLLVWGIALISRDMAFTVPVGGVVLVAGLVLLAYALLMDTTAGREVHNIGLLNEQRNLLSLGSLGVVVGLAMVAWSRATGSLVIVFGGRLRHKTCQFCAESIRVDAIVCRFCGRDLQATAITSVPAGAPDGWPET
jgi:hypothetical protein